MITNTKQIQSLSGIAPLGKGSRELTDLAKKLGLGELFEKKTADVVVITDEASLEKYASDCAGKSAAVPYEETTSGSLKPAKKILTYAVEDNRADVIAKNVRNKDEFISFELLAPMGIGRVYTAANDKPRLILALACGLMLAGASVRDAIALVSAKT